MTLPREVLDAHSALYDRLRFPPEPVLRFYGEFFTEDVLRSMEDNGEMLSRWLQMLAPARNAQGFLEMVRKPLYSAPTYQVAADIVNAVTATYEATFSLTAYLKMSDVPSETGFAWLDAPLVLRDAGGFSIATRALSWGPQYITEDFVDGHWPPEDSGVGRSGIRLTSWSHVDDADSITVPEMADRLRSWGMPLSISHSAFVPFDVRLSQRDDPGEDVTSDDITRWAHTLWMFMGTELVATARPPVERPSRRRGIRLADVSAVNVVTLRRVRTAGREVAHRDIDWSCRWVVQGHHRHLEEYAGAHPLGAVPLDGDEGRCAICGKRITRIRPYVKGPGGLPLKAVPETVYRLAR